MEPDFRYPQVYTVGSDPNLDHYLSAPAHPVVLPTQKERKTEWQKACTVVILFLALLILAGMAFGGFYLFQLHQKIDKIKKGQASEGRQEKIIAGPPEISKSSEIVAHVTGLNVIKNSKTLVWDAELGLALVKGVSYNAGALIINESGNYLIYSKVFFRGQVCKSDVYLEHIVFKRTNLYPKDIKLMVTNNGNSCPGNSAGWSSNSFQSGIFNLKKNDHIYVNVSDPTFVNFDQFNTYFGLHKL
ncbi:tumor necrosis factor ligand superfamily member 6-like [Chiloscyllium punctatum]|uniref:tumor necrosis factor ligand superfamily member 6-like n=1 Tax=Chiloscyllium punctatum TaxID=137246 RepID=UPI003B634721